MTFANLHTHTFFSDGLVGPEALLRALATYPDLGFLALTDHDSMSGIEPIFHMMEKSPGHLKTGGWRFIPGVEISTQEAQLGLSIHLVGLFPQIDRGNYRDTLPSIQEILGDYCRRTSLRRGEWDMGSRTQRAYEMDLEGLGTRFGSAEEIIALLRRKTEKRNRDLYLGAGKEGDIIQHPIPITYHAIIDFWEDVFPGGSKEKTTLYLMRKSPTRVADLAARYLSDGMPPEKAEALARENQGILKPMGNHSPYIALLEGLDLLKRSGAVTILAHPAAYDPGIAYTDFDAVVTDPLIRHGLEGIEVVYPYDPAFRLEAAEWYGKKAEAHGLLISGGTDFHGDGRSDLGEVKLPAAEARRIVARGMARQTS